MTLSDLGGYFTCYKPVKMKLLVVSIESIRSVWSFTRKLGAHRDCKINGTVDFSKLGINSLLEKYS